MVNTPSAPSRQYIKAYSSRVILQRVADGSIMTIERAMFTLDPGIEIEVQKAIGADGRMVPVAQYSTEESPTLELNLQAAPTQVLTSELILGRRFSEQSKDSYVAYDFIVPADGVIPAKVLGQYGFGMADDVASCAVLGTNGTAIQLSRVAGPILIADTLKFTQAANGALEFSSDLYGKSVTLIAPLTAQTMVGLTNNFTDYVRIIAQVINTDGTIGTFSCELALPDFGASWEPGANSISVKFNLFAIPGADRPYELDWINGRR